MEKVSVTLSDHAVERLRSRWNVSKSKYRKVAEKAFRSSVKTKYLNYLIDKNKERDVNYKFFNGYIFVFKKKSSGVFLMVTMFRNSYMI